MFEDYKKAVLNFYLEMKKREQLHAYLLNPTTRRLKKECIRIFSRSSKRDEKTLRLFFDPNTRFEDLEQCIYEFDVEKFRPLLSFIKQERNIRDEEPVKLLALLIGFQPYKEWRDHQDAESLNAHEASPKDDSTEAPNVQGDEPKNILDEQPSVQVQEDENKIETKQLGTQIISQAQDIHTTKTQILTDTKPSIIKTNWRDKSINWKTLTVTICCLLLTFLTFAYYRSKENQQCMYWNGNEYQQVSCSEKVAGQLVLALDKQKLVTLKKITQPDTITYNSIGKVGWAKVNGKVEFYTSIGDHPTESNKRLLPVSKYMIDKYIIPLKH